jgi:hypothetical protein
MHRPFLRAAGVWIVYANSPAKVAGKNCRGHRPARTLQLRRNEGQGRGLDLAKNVVL